MFLLIDKPKGITSHGVIDQLRKITGEKRIGHAGTLDPNATGLLIVGIGRESTKKLGSIAKNTKKTYLAEIFLGEERDTDDLMGKTLNSKPETLNGLQIPKSKLQTILETFIGEQWQTPPLYSAIKIKGKKAYQLARKGEEVKLKPRKIEIYSIELLSFNFPVLSIRCSVSSGTYIRALARDIGKKLDCGAYLINLRRIKIGKYKIENAYKLSSLNKLNWKAFAM